ncbi:MAG: hypothetical protein PW788_05540 [Micavibrio sp.]|nr:hypothetical protein [Micavibrio sp.]
MGPLILLLLAIGAVVAWAYFSWQPPYANKKQLSVFNWSVICAMLMICLSFTANMNVLFSDEVVEKYKWPFAIAGSLGIEICFLAVMFLARNFWIFKPPKQGGKGW